jgi:hypothetical protein
MLLAMLLPLGAVLVDLAMIYEVFEDV